MIGQLIAEQAVDQGGRFLAAMFVAGEFRAAHPCAGEIRSSLQR